MFRVSLENSLKTKYFSSLGLTLIVVFYNYTLLSIIINNDYYFLGNIKNNLS